MTKALAVRGIVASMFAISTAAAGLAVATSAAGAQAAPPPNCTVPPERIAATIPTVSTPEPAMEETDYETVMTLKDEIDRWRRDNDFQ